MPFLVLKVISWKTGRDYSTILQYKKHFRRILCSRYVIYKPAYKLEKADKSSHGRPYYYIVLHIFTQVLFWAGNQGNHQNVDPSLLSNKLWLFFMKMKQKKIFFWKNSKWPTQKKVIFQNRQFLIFFCENSMNWSLG